MTKKHSEQPTKQHDVVVSPIQTSHNSTPNIDNIKSRADFQDDYEFYRYQKDHTDEIKSAFLADLNESYQVFKYATSLTNQADNNPINLTNPYWQALVRLDLSPYDVEVIFDFEAYEEPPLWGLGRNGQSCTLLPDGREILIGGEYEDYYDPQFFIYNDVIVKHPDGEIAIYGYLKHIFPPTDFHTATLVGDEIWIIGSMGYKDRRQFSHTQVYKLNINTFKIEQVPTVNSMGWVNSHNAEYKDGQIIVTGGRILADENSPLQEQIDTWALNLKTLIWTNLTNYQWQGFIVGRKDFDWLHISQYNSVYRFAHSKLDWQIEMNQKDYKTLQDEIHTKPNMDLFATLFTPPIEHIMHTFEEGEEDYRTVTIYIDEVKVRYIDEMQYLQVIVEGILPDKQFTLLQDNLCHKLSKLEDSPCEVREMNF